MMTSLNIYIVTYNCGREQVKPDIFARHFFQALPKTDIPDLVILCLQEVAPISYSFLGGSFIASYIDKLKKTVHLAASLRENVEYVHLVTENIGMTAIMAFVLPKEVHNVKWLEVAGVGIGVQEMGNKGAVGIRIGYIAGQDVMELSVVATHLAPMEEAVERRNNDWKSIVQRLVFTPLDHRATRYSARNLGEQIDNDDNVPLLSQSSDHKAAAPGIFSPNSHLIFAGDLNYRTSSTKPSPLDIPTFPRPTNDSSDPKHYSHLLKKDQLLREMKGHRTCHGLQEAPIKFLPTYKFSDKDRALAERDGTMTWGYAKHRWPSWCDRILYLDLPSWVKEKHSSYLIHVNNYDALPLMSTSDHRPVALSLSIPLKAIFAPTAQDTDVDVRYQPPYEIDPWWRGKRRMARFKEINVGCLAYLLLTWEGNGLLLAMISGSIIGRAILERIFET